MKCLHCEYPGLGGCSPACPNYDEGKPVYECAYCGDGIYPGDEYVEINGNKYHLDCLETMGVMDVLELFGCEVKTADTMVA